MPLKEYPDEELLSIIDLAVDELDSSREELLVDFGIFLVDDLIETYYIYFEDEWDALDVIENVEEEIHEPLRARPESAFAPPELETQRVAEDAVAIEYSSDRQLCEFGKGLINGLAERYDEPLAIDERECMHDGARYCLLVVSRDVGIKAAPGASVY